MKSHCKILTDLDFASSVLQASETLTLVDFWASWCAPCKTIAPFIERLAQDFAGDIVVAKCEVDKNPQTSNSLGIRSIPTLILFKGEQIIFELNGQPDPQKLVDLMEKAIDDHGSNTSGLTGIT